MPPPIFSWPMNPLAPTPAEPRDPLAADALASAERLTRWAEERAFQGWEFDDFLASPLVRLLSVGNLFLQRVWLQVGERLPINLRPVICVPYLPSTKGSGYFARGFLDLFAATGDAQWRDRANDRLDWLLVSAAVGHPGLSWGNDFDFASRGGFFPKGLPTVVWTAHIAQAFDDSFALQKRVQDREAVIAAAEFVRVGLERWSDGDAFCFAYSPGVMNLVHNSNLLGAVTLLRRYRLTGEVELLDLARASIRWSLKQQNPDGSWYYGAGEKYRWIDNFHTAYVLESLLTAHEVGGEQLVPHAAIDSTFAFWSRTFFLEDGTPRYYHDQTYPLDIQCTAQAIETLSRWSHRFPEAAALSERVVTWALKTMRKPNGAFRYRKTRFFTNNLESFHWGEATMAAALGAFVRSRARKELAA